MKDFEGKFKTWKTRKSTPADKILFKKTPELFAFLNNKMRAVNAETNKAKHDTELKRLLKWENYYCDIWQT